MKKMKRLLPILILLCFSLLFSSCASSSHPVVDDFVPTTEYSIFDEETESQTEENPYKQNLINLPNHDFGGQEFRIATDHTELVFLENSSTIAGKEFYLRNLAVEEKYNVKITLTAESGTAAVCDRIRREALAGSDYCDLVLLESTLFQTLASSGALMNVRSVPYLNLNADYYFPRALESTNHGSTSYGFAGDFTFQAENVNVVFFNKTLLSKTALPDLYGLVEQNQWDFENFLLYSEEIASLSANNAVRVNGFISTKSTEELVNLFWAASGFDFMDNEYDTRPVLTFQNEETVRFIDTLRNMLFQSVSYSSASHGAVTTFASGESLFLIAPLSTAPRLRDLDVEWGIVPIPKFDINQRSYYSYLDQSSIFAGFARGTKNPTLSGMVTSALFAASSDLNQKSAVREYLNLYFTSPNDAKMMEKAIENPYYDPVEFLGQIEPTYTAATQTLLYRCISTGNDFDTQYKQYIKMLDKYLDTIY